MHFDFEVKRRVGWNAWPTNWAVGQLGKIFKKHEKYTSKKYGSEMPYTMFFSSDGKAIHGTQMATLRSYLHSYLTESVGSQGCIGLTDDNAKAMFEWAPVGTHVVVVLEEK